MLKMIPIYIKVAIIATLIAAASIGIIIGVVVSVVPSANKCSNIAPPSDLKVTKKENHIVIQWSPTPSNCDVYYNVQVTMDGDNHPILYQTADTFLTISWLPKFCTYVDVVANAVGDEAVSDTVYFSYLVPPTKEEIDAVTIKVISYDHIENVMGWTNIADTFMRCSVKYRLIINGRDVDTDIETNTYYFNNELTKQCKDNEIIIIPIVEEVFGAKRELTNQIEVPPTKDDINAVAFTLEPYVPIAKALKWTDYETVFSGCTVTYRLTINDISHLPDLNTNTFTFNNELTYPCKDNKVKLIPIVSGVSGEEKDISGSIEAPPLEDEINAVPFSVDPYVPINKVLTWSDYKIAFSGCTVTYRLIINGIPHQSDLNTNSFTFTDQLTNPCKNNNVKLIPIVSGVSGEEKDISDNIEAPPLEGEINATPFNVDPYVPINKVLTWTDYSIAFSGCTVTYRLIINGIPHQSDLNTNSFTFTDQLTNPCKNNNVKLIPIVSGVSGEEKDISDNIEAPPLEGEINATPFNVDPYVPINKVLTWTDYSIAFSGCTVTYRLIINGIPHQSDLNTNSFTITDQLTNPCKNNNVKLIPIVSGVSGEEKDISDNIEAPPLEGEINATPFNVDPYVPINKVLSWTDYSIAFSGCTVTYRLIINGIPHQSDLNTNTFTFTDQLSNPCKSNNVKLIPIVSGVSGEEKDISDNIEAPPLEGEINATPFNVDPYVPINKVLTWTDYSIAFSGCTVTYRLIINGIPHQSDLNTNSFTFTDQLTNPCKNNNVKLIPIVSGVSGEEKDISDNIEAPPLEGEINATPFNVDPYVPINKVLSWTDYSIAFSGCTVTYRLIINGIPHQSDLNTNTFTFTDQLSNPCKSNNVKLIPIVSGVSGEEKDISDNIEAPPLEGEINATPFNVDPYVPINKVLTWTDYSIAFSGCTVTYRLIINGIPHQSDLNTNSFTFTDQLTNPCKNNNVKLIPIVSGVSGEEKDISDNIEAPPLEGEINATPFNVDPYVPINKMLSWTDYSIAFSGCTVTYRLIINGIPHQSDLNTNTFTFTDQLSNPCKSNNVKLIPIVSGVSGEEKDISDNIEAPPLEGEINATPFDVDPYVPINKVLTWTDYSIAFSGCTVTYRLIINGIPHQSDLNTNTFTFTDQLSKGCNGNTVVLTPIVSGVEGENKVLSNVVDELPAVEDGSFIFTSEGNIEVTWKRPLNLDDTCELKYDLELKETNESDSIIIDFITDYNDPEPFIWKPTNIDGRDECGDMVVIITPKYESKSGTNTKLDCSVA